MVKSLVYKAPNAMLLTDNSVMKTLMGKGVGMLKVKIEVDQSVLIGNEAIGCPWGDMADYGLESAYNPNNDITHVEKDQQALMEIPRCIVSMLAPTLSTSEANTSSSTRDVLTSFDDLVSVALIQAMSLGTKFSPSSTRAKSKEKRGKGSRG